MSYLSSVLDQILPFQKFVELGRVAYIAFGEDAGKLCTIVNVVDQTRALVDGPCSGVARRTVNFKQLHLTPYKMRIGPGARSRVIRKYWEKEDITGKWKNSTWAKKIAAREKRAQMTDFDRFKLMKAKQSRNRLITIEFGRLRNIEKKEKSKIRKEKKEKLLEKRAQKKKTTEKAVKKAPKGDKKEKKSKK